MKKLLLPILLFLTLLSISFKTKAQYESVLNDTSRYWNIYNLRFSLGIDIFSDSMYLGNNVTINNIVYKELISSEKQNFLRTNSVFGYLREDTVTGKLWFLADTFSLPTVENLVYDLSLTKNDTFIVTEDGAFRKDTFLVDTSYVLGGRKNVNLRLLGTDSFEIYHPAFFPQTHRYDSLKFIEGIGSTRGFDNRVNPIMLNGLQNANRLLCAFKGSQQIFQHQLQLPFLSMCDTINIPVGIAEQEQFGQNLSISPNPTNGLLTFQSNQNIQQVQVFNISGQLVFSEEQSSSNQIDLSDLEKGIYLVKILLEDGSVFSEKVVKQ